MMYASSGFFLSQRLLAYATKRIQRKLRKKINALAMESEYLLYNVHDSLLA